MPTNTNKLIGRIVEYGYTLSAFANKLGITRQTLRNKLYNITDFRASEIITICDLLKIENVEEYFFCEENSQNG